MSNFLFLKKNNENLYNIIVEAEKLFRDEYFEQSMMQTRRFAENICKDLLQDKISSDATFDFMINIIKDQSFGNMRMKEFSEDLYFLKRHGNNSAHSSVACKDGKTALECLERAYEISVFYSNIKYGYNKKLDKSVFSEEVLMTGKSSSQKKLKEKYNNELKKSRSKTTKTKVKPVKKVAKKQNKKKKTKNKFFLFLFLIAVIAAAIYVYLNYFI